MLAELVRSRPGGREATRPSSPADAGYSARARLAELRDALLAERKRLAVRSRWNEPALFFFHRERQAELEAARTVATTVSPLARRIEREVAALEASVEARQAARGVPGLRDAAGAVPVAKPLAELLAIPDDESVLVIDPNRRTGFRLSVRGVATLNQFQTLMRAAGGEPIPARVVRMCRDVEPIVPAGVPMIVDLPFQFFRPAALRKDGTLPPAFDVCDRWLWGWESLAAAPRIDGERVVLVGEPAFPMKWEADRRHPAMAASVQLESALNPFQVADRLSRIVGSPVPVREAPARREALVAAA